MGVMQSLMSMFRYKGGDDDLTSTAGASKSAASRKRTKADENGITPFKATLNQFEYERIFKMTPSGRGLIVGQLIRDVRSNTVAPSLAQKFRKFRYSAIQNGVMRRPDVYLTRSRAEFDDCRKTLGLTDSEFVAFAIHRHLERMESKDVE